MSEKYETPEIEFIDLDDTDVILCSSCSSYVYGNGCTGTLAP